MPFQIPRMSFCIIAFIFTFSSAETYSQEKVMEIGEELKYEISYGFIKLGYVKYILTNSHKDGKNQIFNSRLEVKSYPEVPFIKINEIFESEMEMGKHELFTKKFYETNFKDKSITRTDCKFNYDKNVIKLKKETDGNVEKNTQTIIKKNIRYRDELSWLYDSRINSFISKNFNIPIFVNGEESSVRYSFNVNKTVVNIEKLDYNISAVKMEGTCDYTGFFGYKGEFLILLSDDEERVPLKAYFNSTLGNVVWELISYKKNKWNPPAYMN